MNTSNREYAIHIDAHFRFADPLHSQTVISIGDPNAPVKHLQIHIDPLKDDGIGFIRNGRCHSSDDRLVVEKVILGRRIRTMLSLQSLSTTEFSSRSTHLGSLETCTSSSGDRFWDITMRQREAAKRPRNERMGAMKFRCIEKTGGMKRMAEGGGDGDGESQELVWRRKMNVT